MNLYCKRLASPHRGTQSICERCVPGRPVLSERGPQPLGEDLSRGSRKGERYPRQGVRGTPVLFCRPAEKVYRPSCSLGDGFPESGLEEPSDHRFWGVTQLRRCGPVHWAAQGRPRSRRCHREQSCGHHHPLSPGHRIRRNPDRIRRRPGHQADPPQHRRPCDRPPEDLSLASFM